MKCLLVCEGGTDIPVIRAIAEAHGHEVQPLAPSLDATSGRYEQFGWNRVMAWCENTRSRKAQMLLAFSNAQLLLLHIDTDVAEQIDSGFTAKGLSRRECCEARLNTALGVGQMPPFCHYVLPTMAIETWLLALHDSQEHPQTFATQLSNYEDYQDPESMLMSIGLQQENGRLLKSVSLYERYAKDLVANMPLVRQRCAEFDALCTVYECLGS